MILPRAKQRYDEEDENAMRQKLEQENKLLLAMIRELERRLAAAGIP